MSGKRPKKAQKFQVRMTRLEKSMLQQVASITGLSCAGVLRLAIRAEYRRRKPHGLEDR